MADVQLVEISATEGAQIINSTVEAQQPAQIVLAVPGVQGPTGSNLPASGTTHQVLFKQSNTNYDTGWKLITNDNVDGAAAIAGTKISPNFGSQTIQTTGVFSHALGTAGAPSITFTGDVNTGLYSPGADQVAISTGGTGRVFVDATGRVGIGTTSANAYGMRLAVIENIGLIPTTQDTITTSAVAIKTQLGSSGGEELIRSEITSFTNGANYGTATIFNTRGGASVSERLRITSDGKVGIGTSSPISALEVAAGGSGPARIALGQTSDAPWVDLYRTNGLGGHTGFRLSNNNPIVGELTFSAATGGSGPGSFTYTERLRIDSSGRLLVGTSSHGGASLVALGLAENATGSVSIGAATTAGREQAFISFIKETADFTRNGAISFTTYLANVAYERCRIDSNGRLLVGTSTSRNTGGQDNKILIEGTTYGNSKIAIVANSNAGDAPGLVLCRAKGTAVGSIGSVINNDELGYIAFIGANGTDLSGVGATISARVDGEPGTAGDTTDLPTRMIFSTTADGAATPTERMRIASGGNVGIGETNPLSTLSIRKDTIGGRGAELSIVNYATTTQGNEAALNFGLENSTYDGNNGNAQIKAVLPNVGGAATDLVFSNYNGSAFGEAMRIHNQRELLIGTTTRAANGGVLQVSNGITFPGTQSACSDPNTLDDYEEGTFTPVLRDGTAGTAATATDTQGRYTKIGNVVKYYFHFLNVTTAGLTAGNTIYITGLPFTSAQLNNAEYDTLATMNSATPTSGCTSFNVQQNQTYGLLANQTTTGQVVFTVSQATSGNFDLFVQGTYRVA